VALAAEHLVRHHGLQRVAIVDIDAHHGNGTQHFFEQRPDVLYISLHERPESLPFPGTGHSTEAGIGDGLGYTLNILLDRGCGPVAYCDCIRRTVIPALDLFRPEFILVSAGFDALMWDKVSHLALEPAAYATVTQLLVAAADHHAAGRLVSVLEGGYDLGQLPVAVVAHVLAMLVES
jgi:acetoin utilization deacetylase AcuC-like enzyme